jgi:NAD(P)-dependent dehydrogenase (short-subunit alcohol dehydrogenase family)
MRRDMALHYDFTDRVALITGGSQGIGAGIAAAFVQAGASVVITARSDERLQKTAAELRNDGGRVLAVPADVTDEDAVRALVEQCVQEFGRLDFAINNATDGPMPAPLADIPSDGFSLGIRTNINGTFYGMKHQIPAMLASGGGVIINMASVAGVGAMSNLSAYVSGKAGIIGLSRSAALDYADQGIRINVIAPGTILTDHLRAAGDRAQQLAAQSVPLGRIGTTDDVAACVLWLCSEDASFVTGVTLPRRRRPISRNEASPDLSSRTTNGRPGSLRRHVLTDREFRAASEIAGDDGCSVCKSVALARRT